MDVEDAGDLGTALRRGSLKDILEMQKRFGIEDNGFQGVNDMIERIVLVERQSRGASHRPFERFLEMRSETDAKCNQLSDIMTQLLSALVKIPTEPLSEVLLEERLLKHGDIVAEATARKQALDDRETNTIIAGETNGGKSSLLNVVLGGEEILPTDVLHCTLAITKIKYSPTYSIETLDHSGVREMHSCSGTKDAHDKLKVLVAKEDQVARLHGSMYKEITLFMPAPILKSGMVLVDTPGIGEMEEMDNVTMDYIKSTRADGFIYIIKSDTAGGVQEDRLISFLRAIQEDFKKDSVETAIDPRAAMFICNRWDTIRAEELQIVRQNALTKLDIVWPGFRPEQAKFFSSKQAKLHLDADPELITDKLNDLLLGMNKLFTRVADNNIQSQYRWIKHVLPAASRHLSSMIHHCIKNNEGLEEFFRTVAAKQEMLMRKSNEQGPDLTECLKDFKLRLKYKFLEIFSTVVAEEIEDYDNLITIITDTFLEDRQNKREADVWIVNSLVRHCDRAIGRSGILEELENEAKDKIEDHIGLFKEQMDEITDLVKGEQNQNQANTPLGKATRPQSTALEDISWGHSKGSAGDSSLLGDVIESTTVNPAHLHNAVENLLKKGTKSGGITKFFKRKVIAAVQSRGGGGGKSQRNVPSYVAKKLTDFAAMMRDSDEIIDGFVAGYINLIELYIQSAVEHIPHFTGVNNKLMDNIREHRRIFQENKVIMKTAITELEHCREQVRGYGLLYMEDWSAGNVSFNTDRSTDRVIIDQRGINISRRDDDSGVYVYGRSWDKRRGFWTQSIIGTISIDGEPSEITLKTYTIPIDTNTQLSEIASLRYLKHKNLAPFFGMTRIACTTNDSDVTEKVSAFIFKGSLVPARAVHRSRLLNTKDFVKTFVKEVIAGLECLHRENMVHLELNLDTVMLDAQTRTVQLCQQCKPRAVELPRDLQVPTADRICLSPPVLGGAEYGINDDIYAFVIMLWELLFPENPPYAEQRKWPLETFIDRVAPSKMLGPEIENLDASVAVIEVFKNTLLTGRRSSCLTTGDIKSRNGCSSKSHKSDDDNLVEFCDCLYRFIESKLDEILNDPQFNLKPLERRRPVKRNSKGSLETEDCSTSTNGGKKPIPPPRPKRDQRKGRLSVPNIKADHIDSSWGSLSDMERRFGHLGTSSTSQNSGGASDRGEGGNLRKFSVPAMRLINPETTEAGDGVDGAKSDNKRSSAIASCQEYVPDDITKAVNEQARRRRTSHPEIAIRDQENLQRIAENTIINDTIQEVPWPVIPSTVQREPIRVPVTPGGRKNRKSSLPEIAANDLLRLRESNKADDGSKKKTIFNRVRKTPLRQQHGFDEDDANYALDKGKTWCSSVPDRLNELAGSQSSMGRKSGFFSGIFGGKDKTEKRSKEKQSRLSNSGRKKKGDVPNLVGLAAQQRRKRMNGKETHASEEGPKRYSGLLLAVTSPSPRLDRASIENSPILRRQRNRLSIQSSSSIESLNEDTNDNQRKSLARASSSSSLYSYLVHSGVSDRGLLAGSKESVNRQHSADPTNSAKLHSLSSSTERQTPRTPREADSLDESSTKFTFGEDVTLPEAFLSSSTIGSSGLSLDGALPAMNNTSVSRSPTGRDTPRTPREADSSDISTKFTFGEDVTLPEAFLSSSTIGSSGLSLDGALPAMNNTSVSRSPYERDIPRTSREADSLEESSTKFTFGEDVTLPEAFLSSSTIGSSGLSLDGALPAMNNTSVSRSPTERDTPRTPREAESSDKSTTFTFGEDFTLPEAFLSASDIGSSGLSLDGALPSMNYTTSDIASVFSTTPFVALPSANRYASSDFHEPSGGTRVELDRISSADNSEMDSLPSVNPATDFDTVDSLSASGIDPPSTSSDPISGSQPWGDLNSSPDPTDDFMSDLSVCHALPSAPHCRRSGIDESQNSQRMDRQDALPKLSFSDMSFKD